MNYTYKFVLDTTGKVDTNLIVRSDTACVPFDTNNRDYQQFLVDWEAGAEVLNHDGTPAPYVAAIQELTTRLAALEAK